MTALGALPAAWRADAERIERYGPSATAATLRSVADQLEAALRSDADAVLTLDIAARESGYTVDHLARQIRGGQIPNAGRAHAPRIRRGDLPRKAGHALPTGPASAMLAPARGQVARAVVHSERGAQR